MPTNTSLIDQKKIDELKNKFEKTYGKLNTEEGRQKFAKTVEKMTVDEFNKIKEFNEDNPYITKFLSDFEIYFQKDKEGNVVRLKKPRELQDEFSKAYKTVLKRHKDYAARTEKNQEVRASETVIVQNLPGEKKEEKVEEKVKERVELKNYQEIAKTELLSANETLKHSDAFSIWPLLGAIVLFLVIVGIFWKWIKK